MMKLSDVNLTDEYNYGSVFFSLHKTKVAVMIHIYLGMTASGKYCFMLLPSACELIYYLIQNQKYNELMTIINNEFWNNDIFFKHDVGKFANSDDADNVPFMTKMEAIGMMNKKFIYKIRDIYKDDFNN